MNNNNSNNSNNIKKYLKEKKITQRKLAQLVGVGESAISRYVNGNRIPAGNILIKMAKVLNINAEKLMEEI